MGSVFGDHDRRRRQFGNLMPSWFRMIEGDFFGQRSLAIRAFFGDVFDDFGDSFGRQLQTMMPSMAWLTALLASGRISRKPFRGIERICRGRNGGVRRVAIQALLQLMNDRFEYFDLLTKFDAFGAGRSWIISWIIHDQKLNQIAKSDQISLSQSQSGTERLPCFYVWEFWWLLRNCHP